MDIEKPLTDAESQQLRQYLQEKCQQLPVAFCGFLAAEIINPSIVPPTEWMQFFFGDHELFSDKDEAQNIIAVIFKLEFQTRKSVATESPLTYMQTNNASLFEADDNINLREWCQGFVRGATRDEEFWFSEKHRAIDEGLANVLIIAGDDEDVEKALAEENINMTAEQARMKAAEELAFSIKQMYFFSRGIVLDYE